MGEKSKGGTTTSTCVPGGIEEGERKLITEGGGGERGIAISMGRWES